VNSATPLSESMYGLNSSGGAVELHVFVAKRHLSQALPRKLSRQAPHHSLWQKSLSMPF